MSGYSVEAILKATGADKFASDFDKAKKSLGGMEGATKKSAGGLKSLAGGIAKVAGGIGVTKLISSGFNNVYIANLTSKSLKKYNLILSKLLKFSVVLFTK